MHFSTLVAVAASLVSVAVATASPSLLPFQDAAVLAKRARDRSPEAIICHKTCGNTILGASKEGHCKDNAWGELQKKCDECAPKYDNIAEDYHDKLQEALAPCGLKAPPTSAGGEQPSSAAPSSVAVPPTSTTHVRPTSASQESTAAVVSPASTGLSSLVSSANSAVVSATSTSVIGGTRANASTTARSSSASNDARSSHAVAFVPLVATFAVLFAAAML
ncbi:hypothetical protein HRG_000685 [Hirsutella rhossiliensis]|uniref:Uncharacterized protein n=1 Tax=Hirsutella rhossiliensis TaxID=111463 RepID=A0A9P8SLZ8_9HYPO|nr:uncharacterized protein HRG_00685 [Hirsutella rhossiliensis]KAH0968043.1 hypothetical protein HRG_00685 [Hirsutella rhossiliensis]